VVDAEKNEMSLPTDQDLQFRPTSINSSDVTGKQEATYGILSGNPGELRFTICDRSYDPSHPRQLMQGNVDEWTLTTNVKQIAAIGHPFHIHVNPFEIFSVLDDKGNLVDLDGHPVTKFEPIWKDSVFIPAKWQIKFRTRYADFSGKFVQHCHILDHEDQGMMELVEILPVGVKPTEVNPCEPTLAIGKPRSPYPAPSFELLDGTGKAHTLEDLRGYPVILTFVLGTGCEHCNLELTKLSTAFADSEARLVAISSDVSIPEDTTQESRLMILSDAKCETFRKFGCYQEQPLHGTFVIDRSGHVVWQVIGGTAFTDMNILRNEVQHLSTD
jgi:peroxiredoxin